MHSPFLFVLSTIAHFSLVLADLQIASALSTIEHTPERIGIDDFYTGNATLINGGVANLSTNPNIALASNAETQALRQYGRHKNLRIIYNVAEVYYRIVASKKAGIRRPKDLRGKRIGTIPGTSAGYFVEKYMAGLGFGLGEYEVVNGNTCMIAPCGNGTLPYMLKHGNIDAFGMWEPSVELGVELLGSDALIFQDRDVYREIFNLHSTTEKLNDLVTRKEIVEFLRALIKAQRLFGTKPETVYERVATAVGMNQTVLENVWSIHSWKGGLPEDLLDVMVAEDEYVARIDNRSIMARADLANLIDLSVLEEALVMEWDS